VAMSWFVSLSFWTLFADAFFHALLFAGLCVILWIVLQYVKYETLMPLQRVLNFGILAVIIVALGVGTGYFLDYVFLEDYETLALTPALPVKALTGVMLYVIFVLYFYVYSQHLEIESEQEQAEKPETVHDVPAGASTAVATDSSTAVATDSSTGLERIMVKTRQQIKVIPVNDIVYLRSEGDYVMIIAGDGKYLKEQTMKYFESNLPKSMFIRVHRSYIVNIEYISAVESHGKQNQQVLLRNGEWLKVSPAGYKALKSALR
jgi:hypothetical protein